MITFPKEISQETAKLVQYIIYNPILWDMQEARGEQPPPAIWTADEAAIETGKFILLGEEDYFKDPIPLRMFVNGKSIFRKEEIKARVEWKWKMFEHLLKLKDEVENLLICEAGRGLDIVIANFVKNWGSIICYDSNPMVIEKTQFYFSSKQQNIIFVVKNSSFFEFDKIDKPTILIGNEIHRSRDEILAIQNPNLKHIIINGELLR